ncbi:N-acetylglucosamine-1-phosphotransferase subunits alpha/beta, partial [Thraustotheca clavata]
GLSEYFLYFNDEVFLSAPVYPEDFLSAQGTQNVFFAGEAPHCNSGCSNIMLGDGVCNLACNVEQCEFDYGDCSCDKAEAPVVAAKWSSACRVKTLQTDTTTCAPGCSLNMLGDGKCQSACDFLQCGFDGGDCQPEDLDVLPRAIMPPSMSNHIAVLFDNPGPVIILDTSNFNDLVAIQPIRGVLHAVILPFAVLIFLDESSSIVELQINDSNGDNTTIDIVLNGHILPHGYWYIENDSKDIQLSAATVSQHWPSATGLNVQLYVPWHALPTKPLAILADYKELDVSHQLKFTCNDTDISNAHVSCRRSLNGLDVAIALATPRVRLCLSVDHAESCLVVNIQTMPQPTKQMANTVSPSERECVWYNWCSSVYAKMERACPVQQNHRQYNDLTRANLITYCTRQGSHAPFDVKAAQTLATKMCNIRAKGHELPFLTYGCQIPGRPVPTAVRAGDMFTNSLRHVNRLYTKTFGRTVDRRGVPGHVPHFIQKHLLTELKQQWPEQFQATSSHQFRHPQDMQFAFSYIHYVINRRQLHPPTTLDELFDMHIDINHNGVVDEWEVDNIAILLGVSRSSVQTDCSGSGWTKNYMMNYCSGLVFQLTSIPELPVPTYEVTDPRLMFVMLMSSMDFNHIIDLMQIHGERFVCINDDLEGPNVPIQRLFTGFLEFYWPTPSQFEKSQEMTHDQLELLEAFASLHNLSTIVVNSTTSSPKISQSSSSLKWVIPAMILFSIFIMTRKKQRVHPAVHKL